MTANDTVNIIGAGLAGCEAAYQLAKREIAVRLYEMKPERRSPAHTEDSFAELVCSNSLRSDRLSNAAGLLKAEMRLLDSLVMRAADETRVPAGGALAVDRQLFSAYITREMEQNAKIDVIREEVRELSRFGEDEIVIVAAGPLASEALAEEIRRLTGREALHFFDAAAPIVSAQSVDMGRAFTASRYGRGDDYVNCPLTKEEYDAFYRALVNAGCVNPKGFEKAAVFEGCMPVEVMAARGYDTLRYGPMKPKGLQDPGTGKEPFAVVQLRKEDAQGSMYNLVGFQTHLKFSEQRRVFGMIPALRGAEFLRYGVMHRNTFLDSPRLLDRFCRLEHRPNIRFAGQITGVEGYVESASNGLMCGLFTAFELLGKPLPDFGDDTASGAMLLYMAQSPSANFQPMNVNFGLIRPLDARIRDKEEKYRAISARATERVAALRELIIENGE